MNPVQLVPLSHQKNGVHVFEAHIDSAIGIPTITSIFRTVYDGMKSWYRDNYEGKINAAIQIFGTPFSLAQNLFNIVIRVYQIAAAFGLQNTRSSSYFLPMAISGLVVAGLETIYHLYAITFQLNFAYNFYRLKKDPEQYFSYLFHNFLGINKNDEEEIIERIAKKDTTFSAQLRATATYRSEKSKIRLAKMLPLARRLQPWLVTDITRSLKAHPEGVSERKVAEWMSLIETQMTKKLVLHCLAILTIFTLGVGLALALAHATPILSVVLLTVSPLLQFGKYLFEYGYLDSYKWEFRWENCIPDWIKWCVDKVFDYKIQFTPGVPRERTTHRPSASPTSFEMKKLA